MTNQTKKEVDFIYKYQMEDKAASVRIYVRRRCCARHRRCYAHR